MQSIKIRGRRWIQRLYAKTYNTVEISIDDVVVCVLPLSYGYGDYYLQRAFTWLEHKGHVKLRRYDEGGVEGWHQWAERVGVKLDTGVTDVRRRRDLHDGGNRHELENL